MTRRSPAILHEFQALVIAHTLCPR